MSKTHRRFVKTAQSLVFMIGHADEHQIAVDVFSIQPALGHVFHYPTRPDFVDRLRKMKPKNREYNLKLLMDYVERCMQKGGPPLIFSADEYHEACVIVRWWEKAPGASKNKRNHSPTPTEASDQDTL